MTASNYNRHERARTQQEKIPPSRGRGEPRCVRHRATAPVTPRPPGTRLTTPIEDTTDESYRFANPRRTSAAQEDLPAERPRPRRGAGDGAVTRMTVRRCAQAQAHRRGDHLRSQSCGASLRQRRQRRRGDERQAPMMPRATARFAEEVDVGQEATQAITRKTTTSNVRSTRKDPIARGAPTEAVLQQVDLSRSSPDWSGVKSVKPARPPCTLQVEQRHVGAGDGAAGCATVVSGASIVRQERAPAPAHQPRHGSRGQRRRQFPPTKRARDEPRARREHEHVKPTTSAERRRSTDEGFEACPRSARSPRRSAVHRAAWSGVGLDNHHTPLRAASLTGRVRRSEDVAADILCAPNDEIVEQTSPGAVASRMSAGTTRTRAESGRRRRACS